MMKKLLKNALVLVLLAVFLYSGFQAWRIISAYAQAEADYDALAQYVETPVPTVKQPEEKLPEIMEAPTQTETVGQPEEEPQDRQPETTTEVLWPQVDFEGLTAINADTVGWLTIEGTGIHYPVVQGQDNAYYLSHGFDKGASRAGCLFVDADNDAAFGDRNTVIYGHYTKDRSMFYELRGYKQQDFFDTHPTGWLMTPSAVYRLRFFSGYVSDVYGEAWDLEFGEQEYARWLETCKQKSYFTADVVPEKTDRILTLSTCSYEFENARFVLHAVLEDASAPEGNAGEGN